MDALGERSVIAQAKTFQQSLAFGEIGENKIATWLRKQGNHLIPIYKKANDQFKGPRLLTYVDKNTGKSKELIVPDFLCIRNSQASFIEAKHKTNFAWNRRNQTWVTGIDLKLYANYKEVSSCTGWPVWLLFLHSSSTPSSNDLKYGCPSVCPHGLFGQELTFLGERELERSYRHGNSGMVYWSYEVLELVPDAKELVSP